MGEDNWIICGDSVGAGYKTQVKAWSNHNKETKVGNLNKYKIRIEYKD